MDMSEEKRRCEWSTSEYYPCINKGVLEHGGKWYCKHHHPPTKRDHRKEEDWERVRQAAAETKEFEHCAAACQIAKWIDRNESDFPAELAALMQRWRDTR
jgi:hypothetical protein